MDEQLLEKCNVLSCIIRTTEKELNNLKTIKIKSTQRRDNAYDDGLYSFHIGVNSDMSGPSAELTRYHGNKELLQIIIETLEKQLKEFKEEFENF